VGKRGEEIQNGRTGKGGISTCQILQQKRKRASIRLIRGEKEGEKKKVRKEVSAGIALSDDHENRGEYGSKVKIFFARGRRKKKAKRKRSPFCLLGGGVNRGKGGAEWPAVCPWGEKKRGKEKGPPIPIESPRTPTPEKKKKERKREREGKRIKSRFAIIGQVTKEFKRERKEGGKKISTKKEKR